ncbi:hypothetical protein GALMADRAFT_217653 [Galerina marginata CBS 339.88]|uniref:Uncharacterized protein n=1 Tax=Galerina marginata (strain CBS 339.88) TaxID=685588 RepID=A0A067SBM9_GALM3|nr:hypothetical protein GALMADRAFT_217653 [Galerina marginata CBS 339.88]
MFAYKQKDTTQEITSVMKVALFYPFHFHTVGYQPHNPQVLGAVDSNNRLTVGTTIEVVYSTAPIFVNKLTRPHPHRLHLDAIIEIFQDFVKFRASGVSGVTTHDIAILVPINWTQPPRRVYFKHLILYRWLKPVDCLYLNYYTTEHMTFAIGKLLGLYERAEYT